MSVTYKIIGNIYRPGTNDSVVVTHVDMFDLGLGKTFTSRQDAEHVLSAYIAGLVKSGGTATFNSICQEYKVVMPDGSAHYLNVPFLTTTNFL